MTERQARWLFRGAAVYGLILLIPLCFLETQVAAPAARLPAPEYYYGFIGVASAFQLLYWRIGGDPRRYRALMPIAVFGKLSFWLPAALLWSVGRTATATFAFACGDLVLAAAFLIAWRNLHD